MILRAVHEAHGFEGSERPINGSGPRVLWTLGGGSKANFIFTLCLASFVRATPLPLRARPDLKHHPNLPINGSGRRYVDVLMVF